MLPILDGVISELSNEKIAGLVTVLRHGSRDEQKQAIQKITDDYFDTESRLQRVETFAAVLLSFSRP